MRGYGNSAATHKDTKLYHINQIMTEKRIGILALQETHITEEQRRFIESKFTRRLKVFISPDPENPTGKGSVAVVLNKKYFGIEGTKATEIVPGRALLVHTTIHQDDINILAVYAPNVSGSKGSENAEFWKKIEAYYEKHLRTPKPNVLMGDMNVAEDGMIDRLPTHNDPNEAVDALDNLKLRFGLKDRWRSTYPDKKAFTYPDKATCVQADCSQSRIDRIYVTDRILETAREWKMAPSGIPRTDHLMISVQISSENAPFVGKGRWKVPDHVLKDKVFLEYVHTRGKAAEAELNSLTARNDDTNLQLIWYNFKTDIVNKAKEQARIIIPRLTRLVQETQVELDRILHDPVLQEIEKAERARDLKIRIQQLEQQRHSQRRKDVAVQHNLEGEIPSQFWSQANKEQKPRDMIYALRKLDATTNEHGILLGDAYEKDSWKMAEQAKQYHDRLQDSGINPENGNGWEQTINEVLDHLKT
ncbi:hypothetical protein D9758_004427 [Tetrapyrgos nigripes]|uniref:Endonuclease/exonuclease/phosphatase domain-containing protein n=1 Tax=Tetrapyrgos nigripes TaxID=182062 RepID=A0A8H5GMW5_9AGAR|nr:hypothetical protein D9758_004427 [Tetrapyrgos nigripes]